MRILILNGSPRIRGNTVHLIESFMLRCIELEHDVERIDLSRKNIKPCRACDYCVKNVGNCSIRDDFNEISLKIREADVIVIAAPVYWHALPAQVKLLIDRFYSYRAFQFKTGPKKIGLISVCANTEGDPFKGMLYSFKECCRLLGWNYIGDVLIPGVIHPQDVLKTDGPAKAAELADKF